MEEFFRTGWKRFPFDAAVAAWVESTLPAARAVVADPANAHWLRCGGTWFVGVNALPNDSQGAVAGGVPLAGAAVDFIHNVLSLGSTFEQAQVSVCYPGYPRRGAEESEAAFRFRLTRDAAHVDGLRAEGADRQRHLREHHGFLLGLPLTASSEGAAPLVVWEGSHEIMRAALREAFGSVPPGQWGEIDVTAAYQAARRRIFETCPRVVVAAKPGEAYLVHRLALHGVAPWAEEAGAPPDGRMIAYFRPETGTARDWLEAR